ncbi:hypothetical protein [Endozoicomonas sp. 2B-B]
MTVITPESSTTIEHRSMIQIHAASLITVLYLVQTGKKDAL